LKFFENKVYVPVQKLVQQLKGEKCHKIFIVKTAAYQKSRTLSILKAGKKQSETGKFIFLHVNKKNYV